MKEKERPDSGWSWVVAGAACFTSLVLAGIFRTSGVLFVAFIRDFQVTREEAAWPTVVCIAVLNLVGPFSGWLGHTYGVRPVAIAGAVVGTIGLVACFFTTSLILITVFFGGIFGIGYGLVATLMPVIVNAYFLKLRSTANGIANAGGCFGSILLPPLFETLIEHFGLSGCFLLTGGIVLNIAVAASLLRPPAWPPKRQLASPTAVTDQQLIKESPTSKPMISEEQKFQSRFQQELSEALKKRYNSGDSAILNVSEMQSRDLYDPASAQQNSKEIKAMKSVIDDCSKKSRGSSRHPYHPEVLENFGETLLQNSLGSANQKYNAKKSGSNEINPLNSDCCQRRCINISSQSSFSDQEEHTNVNNKYIGRENEILSLKLSSPTLAKSDEIPSETQIALQKSQKAYEASLDDFRLVVMDIFDTSQSEEVLNRSDLNYSKSLHKADLQPARRCLSVSHSKKSSYRDKSPIPGSRPLTKTNYTYNNSSGDINSSNLSPFRETRVSNIRNNFYCPSESIPEDRALNQWYEGNSYNVNNKQSNGDYLNQESDNTSPQNSIGSSSGYVERQDIPNLKLHDGNSFVNTNIHHQEQFVKPLESSVKSDTLRTFSSVLSSPFFYITTATNVSFYFLFHMYVVVIVDYSLDRGVYDKDTKHVLLAFSIADLFGRLGLGWVTDKHFLTRSHFVQLCMLMIGIIFFMFPLANGLTSLIAISCAYGVLLGATVVVFPIVLLDYLGEDRLPIAYGCLCFANGFANFARPYIIGYFRDNIGSYSNMFYVLGVISLIASCIWFLEIIFIRHQNRTFCCGKEARRSSSKSKIPE